MIWKQVCNADSVKTVTCIGCGLIGGGWVVHFLKQGFNVVVWDPASDARETLDKLLQQAIPVVFETEQVLEKCRQRLHFSETLAEALSEADYVQESAPEILSLKRDLFLDIDKHLDANVIVGSSTSGLLMSDMVTTAIYPQRFVVCHPFNPAYLIPFMEVIPSHKTLPEIALWAQKFFELSGKKVALIDKEVPGFIGNRLQAAIWRECVHMLKEGEASVEQLDMAVRDGLALRWSLLGPFMTFHSAVLDGGMRSFLEKFNGFFDKPWSRLQAPEIDKEFIEYLVTATESAAGGESNEDIVRRRDQGLVAILTALESK